MGTFGGHVLPGSFFIVFAIWWSIQIFRRYFQSMTVGGKRYHSTISFPCSCLCKVLSTWELEGFVIVIFTAVGGSIEIYTAFHDGKFTYFGNAQHATMFFFFGMYGVIRILLHHRVPLPKGIDYVAMALSLVVEALLFSLHTDHFAKDDTKELQMVLHRLLFFAILASIVAVCLEMAYRKSVTAALMRAYCALLQGTWFWQVAFILYNPIPGAPKWDSKPDNLLLVSTFFAWHMAGALLLLLVICSVIGCIYRCRGEFRTNEYDSLSMNLITRNSNGHTIVNINDDSESDIEYEKPVVRGRN